MRKLTRKSLDELAEVMPIISDFVQCTFIGGGDGTLNNPYTYMEHQNMIMSQSFEGGYVEIEGLTSYFFPTGSSSSGSSSGSSDSPSGSSGSPSGSNPNGPSGNESYDQSYKSGFELGFNAGLSEGPWDDIAILSGSFISAAASGTEFGDVNYDMIWFSSGLKDGLKKGQEAKNSNNEE